MAEYETEDAPSPIQVDYVQLKDGRKAYPFRFKWKGLTVWGWGTDEKDAMKRVRKRLPGKVALVKGKR